jgi:hypothetical protein
MQNTLLKEGNAEKQCLLKCLETNLPATEGTHNLDQKSRESSGLAEGGTEAKTQETTILEEASGLAEGDDREECIARAVKTRSGGTTWTPWTMGYSIAELKKSHMRVGSHQNGPNQQLGRLRRKLLSRSLLQYNKRLIVSRGLLI